MTSRLAKTPKTDPRCECGRFTREQARFLNHKCPGQPFHPGFSKKAA